jgi:hypothetical protein
MVTDMVELPSKMAEGADNTTEKTLPESKTLETAAKDESNRLLMLATVN